MTTIPISLGTAGILGIIYLVLTFFVVRGRFTTKVMLGDGSDKAETKILHSAVRAHANFSEYVPLALILLGGIEAADASRTICYSLSIMLIVGRILHPIGIARPAPNPYRAAGAMLTWIMIGLASIEALLLAL
jgi:uncharacterized membrane protein YecN with MAPEG domain